MIRFVLFASAMLVAAAAQAQVYKCLDANGVTVYRQDPCPPSMKREAMSRGGIPPAPVTPAAADAAAGKAGKGEGKSGSPSLADQEQAFRKRQQEAAKAGKEADDRARARAEQCNNAKQRLATYSIGGRISRVDANGERYYMEDSQIEAEKAKAQADVSQLCN